MEKAALYIRVSTDDQTEFSPEAQKKALLTYCEHNNLIVEPDYIYVDEGFSGRKAEKRPAFMKMISESKIKPKPFDLILVHKFDRFARNREDSVVFKSLLKKECGIKVISITEHLEDDKFSIILESMLEAMAEYYSLNLSEEVLKGMTEKAHRGALQTRPPFGYYVKDNKLVIHPDEAPAVKFIFEQFLSGTTMLAIARKLTTMGIKTKSNLNFEFRNVRYILGNEVYLGTTIWCPGRKNLEPQNIIKTLNTHEPIIDSETFRKVQNILQQNKRMHKKYQRPSSEYKHWLSGLMYCSSCGGKMVRQKTRTHLAFQCRNYNIGRCTVSHRIKQNLMETLVLEEIDNFISTQDNTKRNIKIINNTEGLEINKLNKQLSKINDKLARIKEAYREGIDSLEEYKQNKELILKEQTFLKNKLSSFKVNNPEDNNKIFLERLSNVRKILVSNSSLEEKSKAIRLVIDKIIYDRSKESIKIYYVFII